MHSSAPRLSCSKPTSPWTAWTSAWVHAMCNGSIFNIGTIFICGTFMKNALQRPQTLLFQAILSLNCLKVCVGQCYVQWIHIQHRNNFFSCTLKKMHSSAPRLSCSKPTSPWTAWMSAGVQAMCKRSIFIRGTNFISCTLMKKCNPVPQDSPF